MKDFSKEPKSFAELKADKTQKGSDWTPRDCLINLLREIDSGEVAVDNIIICYDDRESCSYSNACKHLKRLFIY